MTRLTLTLAAWMTLVPMASASLTPRKEPRWPGKDVPSAPKLPAGTSEPAAGRRDPSEFVVTGRTRVLLDGKPCKYEEVPAHARIVGMEVAADRKTVLEVRFRTGK